MPCEIDSDRWGSTDRVPSDSTFAGLEVWWAQVGKDRPDTLFIRQENEDERADVIIASLGQAYDLLDALNCALGTPAGERESMDAPKALKIEWKCSPGGEWNPGLLVAYAGDGEVLIANELGTLLHVRTGQVRLVLNKEIV